MCISNVIKTEDTMIPENQPFRFLVTYVEADNQYLKIWAQTNPDVIKSITNLINSLQSRLEYYSCSGKNIPANQIKPLSYCCARKDDHFARAKIIQLRSDGMVLVHFVDYGNKAYVSINNICLFDELRELSCLKTIPDAATDFILADVAPIGGVWMDDVIASIQTTLINRELIGVYKIINGNKVIKFELMNEEFNKLIVNRNMARYSAMQPMTIPPLQSAQQEILSQENWKSIKPIQKIRKSNTFKAIQLEIGSFYDVCISHVEEGPYKFSVQLKQTIPYLNSMMEKINNQNHLPLQEPPIAGTVCLGRQSSSNKLCRIVLNSPGDTSCKVYFADYGNHETLSFSKIYQIPDEFMVPDVFSIRFTLSGIMNWNMSQDMKDYFGGLTLNKDLRLKVCQGPNSPLIQYCELFLEGTNVKDILIKNFPESCVLTYTDHKCLREGSQEIVFVSFVESITKFFVQLESESKLLDEIMCTIENISKTAAKLVPAQMHVNMPCLALYDVDNKWYRASILRQVSEDKVLVFYVDYGNEEVVLIDNLRVIPLELVEALPRQAIPCSLKRYQSGLADKELTTNFENLVLDDCLNLIVLKNLNDMTIVDLFVRENSSSVNIDVLSKLKALEITKLQKPIDRLERSAESSFKPLQVKNQKYDGKNQVVSVQKQRSKNKNIKTRDNWTGNYKSEGYQNQASKSHASQNYEIEKSKFRKENENEQRHDNRLRKANSDFSSVNQSNRFDNDGPKREKFGKNDIRGQSGSKDYSNNDRFNRGSSNINFDNNDVPTGKFGKENQSNRTSINSRLERNFHSDKAGSDKDSDTSSRSSGSRNNRERRNDDDQRRRNSATSNRNGLGRWENDEQDANHNNYSNISKDSTLIKSPNTFNKSKSLELDISSKQIPYNKDTSRYITSTPISKIPPPNITVGAEKVCIIVYYTDPTDFFVQLHPDSEGLDEIMNKIKEIYHNGGKVLQAHEIKPDLHCIVQYSDDNEWYRATIKSATNFDATVQFVDYGNVETVSFDKIKEIEPEFLKLPAQAIHCKLFSPQKLNWTKQESSQLFDETEDKQLEAEFILETNGIYEILIKELNPDRQGAAQFLNELFVSGVDFNKEKQLVRTKIRSVAKEQVSSTNYASLDDQWMNLKILFETSYDIHFISWFTTPQSFYCQLNSHLKEFQDMMNEIQSVYINRHPISEPLKVGSPAIALFQNDEILYRAEILDFKKPRGYLVKYIDYGNQAYVHERNIYLVEKKYMTLPRQAVHCSLKNVSPLPGSTWPCGDDRNFLIMQKLFDGDKFECIFHDVKNNQYLISLNINGTNITETLRNKNLATILPDSNDKICTTSPEDSTEIQDIPRIDLNLLEGQTLLVKVSSIDGVAKFYVQFYTAETCQSSVNTFMATSDPKMLRLPGKLAMMQNQAIECALFDVPLSSNADDALKTSVAGKDVKIFVEKVESNRLIVRMFDLEGNKIKVTKEQNTEEIHPVCNMQILNSTHDVIVTHIDNSNSIWLHKKADSQIENELLDTMYNFYSTLEECVVPEENKLYAGLSEDWYRVLVMKVKETEVTARLIDYGPIRNIPIQNLRNLQTQFHLPHQLAVEVSLTVCLEGDNDAQKSILEPLLNDKEFTATFYNVNRKWIAELSENGKKLSDRLSDLKVIKETTQAPFEYISLPEMRVGEKYDVIVSHIDSPTDFWIHRYEDLQAIRNLQAQIQVDSSELPNCNTVLEEKSLCLAMYSIDDSWYRAEVIDADSEITTVRFIDFGNTDVIINSENKLKDLSDKLKSIKKYAIKCKLDVVSLNESEDDWSEEACRRFSNLVKTDSPLQAYIIADKFPMRIELFLGDQSICKTLIDQKVAVHANNSEQLDEDIVDELEFDPKSAFVSHSISVDEFWMHEEKRVSDLEMMQDRLVIHSMLPKITKVENDLFCIAHFPEDNAYYRAVVLSHNQEGTLVRYIDYGNTALTNDIKEIPEDLAKIPPLSRKCCLVKPDGVEHWPTGVNEKFDILAANGATIFILDIIEEGSTSLVKLSYEGKDVATDLVQQCSKQTALQSVDEGIVIEESKSVTAEERPSPIGEETTTDRRTCDVTYVNSPLEFWIQFQSDYPYVDIVMERLEESANLKAVAEVNEGKILVAKFDEDGAWYRCKILSKGDNGIDVFYIDYGNSASIIDPEESLRELPQELEQYPAFAHCCSLKIENESSKNLTESICQKFKDLCQSERSKFEIQILEPVSSLTEQMQVRLFYKDQDVLEILLNHEKILKESEGKNSSSDSAIQCESEHNEIKKQSLVHATSDTTSDSNTYEVRSNDSEIKIAKENISEPYNEQALSHDSISDAMSEIKLLNDDEQDAVKVLSD